MTFEQAIELLRSEFKRAQSLEYVTNPLGFALYQVWKKSELSKTKGGTK